MIVDIPAYELYKDDPPGIKIGQYNNVILYGDPVAYPQKNISYDLRFQCIEYVKRYYWQRHKIMFPIVTDDCAYNALDDWNDFKGVKQYKNGKTCVKPKPGDIIIFAATKSNPYGHIAIINRVSDNMICFVQQNWPGESSGQVEYQINKYGFVEIEKYYGYEILGWLGISSKFEIVSTTPKDYAANVVSSQEVKIEFSGEIRQNENTLKSLIKIKTLAIMFPTTVKKIEPNIIIIKHKWLPAEKVEITLDKNIQDVSGASLGKNYIFSFCIKKEISHLVSTGPAPVYRKYAIRVQRKFIDIPGLPSFIGLPSFRTISIGDDGNIYLANMNTVTVVNSSLSFQYAVNKLSKDHAIDRCYSTAMRNNTMYIIANTYKNDDTITMQRYLLRITNFNNCQNQNIYDLNMNDISAWNDPKMYIDKDLNFYLIEAYIPSDPIKNIGARFRIRKFSSTGQILAIFEKPNDEFPDAGSIACDNLGNVYVAQFHNIVKFSNNLQFSKIIDYLKPDTTKTYQTISGICCDQQNNIYAVRWGGSWEKYDSNFHLLCRYTCADMASDIKTNGKDVYILTDTSIEIFSPIP